MSLSDDLLEGLFASSDHEENLKDSDSFYKSFSDSSMPRDIRRVRQLAAMERLQAGSELLLSRRNYGPGDFVCWKSDALKTHRVPGVNQPAYVLEVTQETQKYIERREETRDLSGSLYQALKLNVKVLVEMENGIFAEYWLPGDRLHRFFNGDLKKFVDENTSN